MKKVRGSSMSRDSPLLHKQKYLLLTHDEYHKIWPNFPIRNLYTIRIHIEIRTFINKLLNLVINQILLIYLCFFSYPSGFIDPNSSCSDWGVFSLMCKNGVGVGVGVDLKKYTRGQNISYNLSQSKNHCRGSRSARLSGYRLISKAANVFVTCRNIIKLVFLHSCSFSSDSQLNEGCFRLTTT